MINVMCHICGTSRAKAATFLPSENQELLSENPRQVATFLYVPIRFFRRSSLQASARHLLNCADFLLNCAFFR
jgi:hypothetical protein